MSQPQDRYISLDTQTLTDGRVVYKSAIPITVTVDPLNDLTFVTNERDRMDILAKNKYGSVLDWWKIAQANNIVNGSLFITPGTQLIIPSD